MKFSNALYLAIALIFWVLASIYYSNNDGFSLFFFAIALLFTIYASLKILYVHSPYNILPLTRKEETFIFIYSLSLTILATGVYSFEILNEYAISGSITGIGVLLSLGLYSWDTFKIVKSQTSFSRQRMLYNTVDTKELHLQRLSKIR